MTKHAPENTALLCPRPDLIAIRVTGSDAKNFLHAQTTQAINDLPVNGVRRAAWLSAKGRVRAIFDVVADGDTIWLVTDSAMVDQVVKQMGMYVLRADAQINVETDRSVWSVVVDDTSDQPAPKEPGNPGADAATDAHEFLPNTALVATKLGDSIVYGIDSGFFTIIANGTEYPEAFAAFAEGTLNDANLALIRRGIPNVSAETFEHFIPQMLNLDRLDAISFNKGCYPGQEIVARTANLGQVKRRLQRFSASGSELPAPGGEIKDRNGNTVGEVNRVAATATGELELLAVASLDAADQQQLLLEDRFKVSRLNPPD